MALVHTVANAELRRRGAYLAGDKYADLVGYLSVVACRVAVGYDPSRSGDSYTFPSYLFDVLKLRTTDYYRRKAHGFDGDHRYANSMPIVPVGDILDMLAVEGDRADTAVDPEDADLDAAADALGEGLSVDAEWTLRHVVPALAEGALIAEAAAGAGISVHRAKRQLDELREELAPVL